MRELQADYAPMLNRFVEILRPVLGDFAAAIYPVDDRTIEIACDTADDHHHRRRVTLTELNYIRDPLWCAEFAAHDFAAWLYSLNVIRRMPVIESPKPPSPEST